MNNVYNQAQDVVEAPRYSCALGGAYMAALAINKTIPILHAGPGCGFIQTLGFGYGSGEQGVGYIGGNATPSSNLSEKEVVYGGENRLRDQIKGTLEIVKGDLFAVISGCIPAMIGDDVDSIVKEFRDKTPIFHINAPGFKGNSYDGYELFLEALIDQVLEKSKKEIGLVNIFGIVPNQDVFWKGDLKELKKIFEKLGLKANVLFGDFSGIDGVKKLSSAELTVVLSPWVGINAAKKLEEKYDIPFLTYPGIPVGPRDASEFLHQLGEKLSIQEKVEEVIKEEEKEAYRSLDYAGDILLFQWPTVPTAIVADSTIATGVLRFITNEANFIPTLVIITDNPPEEYRQIIEKRLTDTESAIKPKIIFEVDSGKIRDILREHNFTLLLASSQEKYFAEDQNIDYVQHGIDKYLSADVKTSPIVHVTIAFPAFNRLILDRSYVGYRGGSALIEDIGATLAAPF